MSCHRKPMEEARLEGTKAGLECSELRHEQQICQTALQLLKRMTEVSALAMFHCSILCMGRYFELERSPESGREGDLFQPQGPYSQHLIVKTVSDERHQHDTSYQVLPLITARRRTCRRLPLASQGLLAMIMITQSGPHLGMCSHEKR